VFSNGNTITTSAFGFCARARVAAKTSVRTKKKALNTRNFKIPKLLKRNSEG
jgi:hypothetical protein